MHDNALNAAIADERKGLQGTTEAIVRSRREAGNKMLPIAVTHPSYAAWAGIYSHCVAST